MRVTTKNGCLYRDFDTWNEYVERAIEGERTYGHNANNAPGHSDWCGGTWEEAVERAHRGWAEGVKGIVQVLGRIEQGTQHAVQRRWKSRRDVRGSSASVPRYLAGEPLNMKRRVRVQQIVQRSVRIGISVDYSGGISTDVILRRGAVIVAIVDALRRAGRPTNVDVLTIGMGSYDKTARVAYSIPVATPGQPLDMGRVAFATASPLMLRRLVFSMNDMEDDEVCRKCGFRSCGYGHPGDHPRSGEYDLYFGRAFFGEGQWNTPEHTAKWIVAELEKLGVRIVGHENVVAVK